MLESDQPPHGFDKKDSLAFEFNFTGFLPRHIMPNFIVGRHKAIVGEFVWQNGVILEKKDESAKALVQVDYHDRKLALWVCGRKANEYFKILYDDIKEILDLMPELRFSEWVIVPEESRREDGQFFHRPDKPIKANFRQLLAMEDKGRTEYDCEYGTFDLAKILQIMPKEARLTVARQDKLAENIHIGDVYISQSVAPAGIQPEKKKWYQQWWFYSVSAGLSCGIAGGFFAHSWKTGIFAAILSFGATMFFNPKSRYFRAAWGVFASIGGMNALSALEGNIYLSGLADKPVAVIFKLGFGDNPLLNVALVALAGLLFVLDYYENKNK
ncbi:MAG: hypothetical protein ACTFAL_02765 [Candidatus Electronema sp. V4]|uniref:hypothetical protein n=1 Tax=Candidatus Electronema sp. V4 TaxID=3454756 RepID=UPI004055501A